MNATEVIFVFAFKVLLLVLTLETNNLKVQDFIDFRLDNYAVK